MNYLLALTTTLLTSGFLLGNTQAAEWSYDGVNGPQHWAQLDGKNATCATGQEQSPLDIQTAASRQTPLPVLGFHYQRSDAEVVNNGHTVQVNFQAGNQLTVAGRNAELLQFHFHAPSEERFDGKAYPMDAHLVHKTADGKLSVVAVQFKKGEKNQALEKLLEALPDNGQRKTLKDFNPAALLPSDHTYYRYTGSLTTPPCSEQVSWQVLKQPVELSQKQIEAFRKLYKMNARPVQPLNGRVIELSE